MRKFLFSCTMLAAFSANVAADPFVSGSEPGWGKHLSSAQRRTMGFEDVPAALKAAGYDNDPQPRGVAGPGVPGFVFNVLTIRHTIHGHDGGSGGGSGGGGGGGDISGPNIETAARRLIPPKAPPFQ